MFWGFCFGALDHKKCIIWNEKVSLTDWSSSKQEIPKHTICLQLFKNLFLDIKNRGSGFSFQFSDLSPIENLQREFKVNVHAQKAWIQDEQKQFAMEDWAKIPQETCPVRYKVQKEIFTQLKGWSKNY